MKKIVLYFTFFIQFFSAFSQEEIWSINVGKDAFMTQIETGHILIKEKKKITLLDHLTGEALWSTPVSTKDDPVFLDNLPIFYFSGKSFALINAKDGTLLESDENRTHVANVHYFWEKGKIVFELYKNFHLCITVLDLHDLKVTSTHVEAIVNQIFGIHSGKNDISLAEDGSLIIVDFRTLVIIDPDGKIKHTTKFKKTIEKIDFNTKNNYLYLLEGRTLHFVNTNSGKIESTIKLKDSDFSFDLIDDGDIFATRDGKKLTFLNSTNGTVIAEKIYDEKIRYTYLDPKTNKYYLSLKKSVHEINHKDAETIRSAEVGKSIGKLYLIQDRIFMNDNGGTNEIDLETLKPKYSRPIPLLAVTDVLVADDNILYINIKESKMYMVDKSGAIKWDKDYSNRVLKSVDIMPAGVLAITDAQAYLYDVKAGESILENKIATGPSMVYILNEETNILTFYSSKRIKRLNLNTGKMTVSEERIGFKDFDYSKMKPYMSINDKYIYLKGSNSIYILDLDCNLLYEKHYKRLDNKSKLVAIANAALALTATIVIVSQLDDIHITSHDHSSSFDHDIDFFDGSMNYTREFNSKRRRQQNRTSAMYPYVHTRFENGKDRGLIFIDQTNGKHKYVIKMPEKEPIYIVDEIDGQLYYITDTKLTAYTLK